MVRRQFFNTIIFSFLLSSSVSFATPDLLPFQGRLTDSTGSPINIATVVKFRIYPPSGSCYLYEDTQTITPNTYGIFTALLGAAGNKTFSGPMVNFRDVFNNSSAGIVNNCSTLYIPAQNDWRRIELEAGGVTSPDMQTIGAAPFSFESKNSLNLGGLPSTSFLRVNGALTQFAAEALVNGNDASAYHDHDSLYARLDGSTPYTGNISTVANIYTTAGTVGIGTAAAAADLEVNKTNPDIRLTATAAGGGTSKIDFFSGAAAQRASIQSSEATNEMRFFTGTTEAMRLDANQNAFFNSSLDVAGTLSLGQYSTAQETGILLPSLTTSGAAANGTIWVNTGGVIKYWDGGNIRTIANLNAVVNSVTAGTGTTIGGTATAPTVSVNYGTTAGTAIQGNATFGGDVSGTYSNLNVERIDGSAVDLSVAPAATQVLKFNGTAWVAAADSTGIVAETDPTVTAWAKNAPAANFVTTGNVLQLSNSGVTAGTYGSGSAVPVLTVDIFGRISSVTNTSIGINANQVTAGILPVARGGTGATTLTGEGILVMNTTGTAATSMTCPINQILKWTGTAWACAADNDSVDGDASYAAKGNVQFDTSAVASGISVTAGVARLANSGATAGSYGSGTQVPAITVDAFGRITSVANTAISLSASDITSGTLPIARGGTNSTTALNNNRLMVSSGGAIVESSALTNGQLLIGSTGVAPVAAAITGGGGLTVTNGAGSITLGVNTAVLQARVTGTCAAGSSIREIASDGTVTCETDDSSSTPGDASYVAKGIIQFDTSAAASGITVAAGVARLANSGVTAATYGSATQVPVFAVDAFGRVTSVTNTTFALSATDITSGTLPTARGGTNSSAVLNNNRIMVSNVGSIVEAAALTNGQLFVGVTGAAPSAVTMSGDATLSSIGVLTLAANSLSSAEIAADTIVDSDINSAAAITATKIAGGTVDNTEFGYLNGVTSAIQTQLAARLPLAGGTMTGTLNAASNGLVVGTNQLVVSGGSVGVNTATPSATYKLDVVGDIRASAFFYSSDRRLKYNIEDMKGLETILRLRGVTFQWKDDGRPEIGLIAQEVEKVAPELVQTDAETGLKAVKYGNLVAPLIESVKELYGMCESNTKSIQKVGRSIASHDEKIKTLESTVESLKNENLQMRQELIEIKKLLQKK